MLNVLLVGLGGFAGAVARYGASVLGSRIDPSLPYATLAVNVLGCLAVGGLIPLLEGAPPLSERSRLLLVTGFLGGFTTFSAFGLETHKMVRDGQPGLAVLYVLLSVGLGLGAVGLGKGLVSALR